MLRSFQIETRSMPGIAPIRSRRAAVDFDTPHAAAV